jgi:DNA-directed RNA polymerase subunit RPC12/RpoP
MQTTRIPGNELLDTNLHSHSIATNGIGSGQGIQTSVQENALNASSSMNEDSMDHTLLKLTQCICEKHKIHFGRLSPIQRKFITHYRCHRCGLLPVYNLDLSHLKRVRCRKCGQLVSFKKNGKYGKLRKEIAVEIMKEMQ